jgi:glycosyltransferase involved in cell wall biosynthesis
LAAAQAISFCSLAQARPFMDVGLIAPSTTVYEVPETSSRFTPGDRLVARRASGVYGDPAILWVGHLDSNKDPLTVLDGVAAAVPDLPDAQMWCCFGKAPLMPKVEARIAGDERLRDRVHLLGRVSHDRVEQLMRAADIFVLGSHREGSGCSLIEALACGLPAAVTSIPSFAALMGPEGVGATWPCGDAEVLRQALVRLAAQPREALREAVRGHFERELSFEGVGRKLINVYEGLLRRRSRPTPHNG